MSVRACRALCACCALVALAQARAQSGNMEALLAMSLQELANIRVVTATKAEQSLRLAPAVISVISADDIRMFGYRSVAEALAQVPGLYAVYDHFNWNVGVRGINAGVRAYSRILKVMIDGEPVAFRADGSNYLGPELINLDAVERIEVVRGPVSALYGADAFLGVVNVITRRNDEPSHRLSAQAFGGGEDGGGGGFYSQSGAGAWRWLLAAAGESSDRSDQALPRSSPLYASLSQDGAFSRHDQAEPRTLYARLGHESELALTELSVHAFRLDSYGEFLDFGVLSHDNRLALNQQSLRLRHEYSGLKDWTLRANVSRSQGEPDEREHLSFGQSGSYPARDFRYAATTAGLEARRRVGDAHSLSVGVDLSEDEEHTIQVYSVDASTGQRTLIGGTGAVHRLRNQGMYLQWNSQPVPDWELTANLRYDHHSSYGDETNLRLALVGDLSDRLALKLLYGTAYKAPAAMQLYAQPLYAGEVLGNPALTPESARILELAISWQMRNNVLWTANGYTMQVSDKVELLPRGPNQQPQNSGKQEGQGAESELHWQGRRQQLSFRLAWQDTDDVERQPFLGELTAPTASYPRLVTGLTWQYRAESWGNLALSGRYVSARRASKSNRQENFLRPYELAPYQTLDGHWHRDWGAHRLGLRIVNLLDEDYEEPGYGGADLPGQRRTYSVRYSYRF